MDINIQNTKLCGEIRAISAKSDVHRFLIAAALAPGRSKISFTTLSADISATVGVLRTLGAEITVCGGDGDYTATVLGARPVPQDCVLDAGECGTTARLCLPVAAALTDGFTMTGEAGLAARPFADLCTAMQSGGADCSSDRLPIRVRGRLTAGDYTIRGDVSSQYISGLLFALPLLGGDSRIHLSTPLASAGYVDMTLDTLSRFGVTVEKAADGYFIPGGQTYRPVAAYAAEGDWSNAAFWLCAGALGGDICVRGLDRASRQRDRVISELLQAAGADVSFAGDGVRVRGGALHAINVDGRDIPDLCPVLACVLACADGESKISGSARLRLKESDRIASTTALLCALGGDAVPTSDGFVLHGKSALPGGVCAAANDHRIAMCAAVLACRTAGGVRLLGAQAVNKSYPTFFHDFQKLGGTYSVITNG